MLSKNTCEGVHLIVKLPAISLQASKFTKNELLQTYFPRNLAIIYCAFSRNHFMEGCFMFQWGGCPSPPLWETLYMMVTLAFNELNISLVPTREP